MLGTVRIGEADVAYKLRRSPVAKRARLTVTPGVIEVIVPEAATDEQITGVLARRRAWLAANWEKMQRKARQAPSTSRFTSGAKLPFRGRMMRLHVSPSPGNSAQIEYRNGFYVQVPEELSGEMRDRGIAIALRLWLKRRVRRDVLELVRRHGEPNGLTPREARTKDMKHMWGSCGRDRVVNLNWQLVFAPKPVLEYAVVHELVHLRHRSHEPTFWTALGAILPNWRAQKRWLDENEHLLSADVLIVGAH